MDFWIHKLNSRSVWSSLLSTNKWQRLMFLYITGCWRPIVAGLSSMKVWWNFSFASTTSWTTYRHGHGHGTRASLVQQIVGGLFFSSEINQFFTSFPVTTPCFSDLFIVADCMVIGRRPHLWRPNHFYSEGRINSFVGSLTNKKGNTLNYIVIKYDGQLRKRKKRRMYEFWKSQFFEKLLHISSLFIHRSSHSVMHQRV